MKNRSKNLKMSENSVENMQNSCRICVVEPGFTDVEEEIDGDTITYAELFQKLSGFEIRESEPHKICQKCSEVLVEVRKLLQRAKETQVSYERMLDEIRDESDSFTEFSEPELPELIEKEIKPRQNAKSARSEQKEECEHCKRKFWTLERHLLNCKRRPHTETDKDLHVCPVCSVLSSADHIRHHTKPVQKKSSPGKSFVCDICGITTLSRSNIDMHMKVQHLSIRSQCRHCPGTFKNPSALARHMRKSHSEKLQDYRCRTCNFRTSIEKEARNHRESHRLKKLVCHECGQAFLKAINLKYHLASHSDARPFKCETCGSAFKTTKALGAHKKTHMAYDYECPVCGRSYLTNQLMRNHVEKNHKEYELPPPGTVLSKSYRKKMAERQLREIAIKQGVEMNTDTIIVPETVINLVQSVHVVR